MAQDSENVQDLKKLVKESLDENFGPLLLRMAKMIRDMSDVMKTLENSNQTLNNKLESIIANQNDTKSNSKDLTLLLDQFDKLDKNLAKFLQKSIEDTKNIQKQIDSLEKEGKLSTKIEVETPPSQQVIPEPTSYIQPIEIPNLIANMDIQEIKNIIAEFSKKEIYTTEALRLIEETRDRLLFEREDEAPYRAFAAKIFREVLAIIKQEKDFRLISPSAAQEVKKRLSYLQEHM